MLLRPIERNITMKLEAGAKAQMIGNDTVYIITAAGARWYRMVEEATGKERMAKVTEIVPYAPPAPPKPEYTLDNKASFADLDKEFSS